MTEILNFLNKGGPALWIIFLLSIVLLSIIFYKLSHFMKLGVWNSKRTELILDAWKLNNIECLRKVFLDTNGIRETLAKKTILSIIDEALAEDSAREECEAHARNRLHQANKGLRTIELISHIAPLLGLLGTVLGMIEAFQRLQESGNQADPSILAGGIWEALLTTAAGMAVAIVATVSLSFFDNIIDKLRNDLEDLATQIFTRKPGGLGV
tara:strand:+ start:735 stop:1367 length:633 start_codon:yes stop_codon:yes gene_type:complete